MRALVIVLAAGLAACGGGGDDAPAEAGVGSDVEGCGEPGSHSVLVDAHSCACEPGFEWCSDALDDLTCCPSESSESESSGTPPDAACGPEQAEQIACIDDPLQEGPGTETWACNGERWIEVAKLFEFECQAQGYQFGYGCVAATDAIDALAFVCGYGPGSTCDAMQGSACVDAAIIDTCVWGRRTIDYCRRLCDELELWGPGFVEGSCVEVDGVASCVCS
jgi:hypothetical protein